MSSKQNIVPPDTSSVLSNSNDFYNNISLLTDDRLCEVVVSARYIGVMVEEARMSMEELAKRRDNGSLFNYEERIKELGVGLPEINIDLKKAMKTLNILKKL